jgi:hypothetical protein
VTITDAVDTVVCAPDDEWKWHPKHVEQFPYIYKLCNVASCWIYEYIGILLGAHPILHFSRIKVKRKTPCADEWPLCYQPLCYPATLSSSLVKVSLVFMSA